MKLLKTALTNSTILVVAAHPDDEILGCGGTIARLAKTNTVYSLVLGEGITSRDTQRDPQARKNELTLLKKQMKSANKVLGVSKLFFHELPDNRFDTVALLDVTKLVEAVVADLKPSIVFTHYEHDLNIDHQVTHRAVLTATRPLPGQSVKEIYAFETVSSTEFRYPLTFSPDTFCDITQQLKKKKRALSYYTSEMRPFPHPRSLEMVELNARYWGTRVGLPAAEAFQTVRSIW